MPDHAHICLSFPLKYSIAMTVGYLKSKSAILIHREIIGKKRLFPGLVQVCRTIYSVWPEFLSRLMLNTPNAVVV